MESNSPRQDPAFPAMTLDLIANILSRAANPGELAPFITEGLRELTGARCVLLYEYDDSNKRLGLLGINPIRLLGWAEEPDQVPLQSVLIDLLLQAPANLAATDPRGLMFQQKFGLSLAVPLRVGNHPVGVIALLGLQDAGHLDAQLATINTLSTVVALVLRNAVLYQRQEQVIAERTSRLEALNEALRQTQFSVDAAADAIFWLRPNGRFHYVNDAACKLLEHSREELLEMGASDFNPDHTLERYAEHWSELKQRRSLTVEAVFVPRPGKQVQVEITANYVAFAGQEFNCSFIRDVSSRKSAESLIEQSKAELEAIYDSSPVMMCLVSKTRGVERMNRTMLQFVKAAPATQIGDARPGDLLTCINALHRADGCGGSAACLTCTLRAAISETLTTGLPCRQVETVLSVDNGTGRRQVRLLVSTAAVRLHGQPKVVLCLEDITSRKQLEAQLLQAQKMEAVGQLAGGVAHDFNNILAAMLMQLELLQQRPGNELEIGSALKDLEDGVRRAASLTRQLLLFSRRSVMQTRRIDLSEVVDGMMKMLRRLLGEHIAIEFTGLEGGAWVDGDAGMLEQVLLNLCVNARDAMPKGGQLRIRLLDTDVGPANAALHQDARTGRFFCLEVRDTGCGMDALTLQRIFEPFFTTKEAGKGTGLGLATVYGITRQHQGWVQVQSAVSVGTTFRVFLPPSSKTPEATASPRPQKARGGSESVLLVEDDENVRAMAVRTLKLYGYEVLEASTGVDALRVWEECGHRVSLLLTDMVMPGGMTGLELAEELRQLRPSLKVIITSGYSADLVRPDAMVPKEIAYLPKPYDLNTLAKAVRDCLDGKLAKAKFKVKQAGG